MSQDAAMGLVGALGALVLIGSGLARRRMPRPRWLMMALAWAAIIALVWAAVAAGSGRL